MPAKLRIENGVAWVGDRRMPEGTQITSYDQFLSHPELMKRLKGRNRQVLLAARGFELPYENGWTVSVGWQKGFSLDADQSFEAEPEAAGVTITDRNGRIVVWDDAGSPIGKSLDHPGLRPDVPAAEILRIIDDVVTWPTDHLPVIDRV